MDEEERAYRQNVIHAARSSLLNDAWQQESPDLRWAPRAVDLLHYTYQGEEFRDVEMQTECKTTLCRIVVKGANELAGQTAVQRITQLSPWPTSGIANYDIEKREGRVYLAREGFPLPQLDAQPDPLSGTE